MGIDLAITQRESVTFRREDDNVYFVLDFHLTSSLRQQLMGRHLSQLGIIISILSQTNIYSYSSNLRSIYIVYLFVISKPF